MNYIRRFAETAADTTNETTTLEELFNTIVNWISTEGLRMILGLVGLFIIFKVVNFISRRVKNILEKKHVDKTIESVVVGGIRKGLKALALIAFVGFLGFETSSIAALITSLGVGLGLALQGSLSNLAGGIIILVMRPFKIGDYIESNGMVGTVEEIKVFYTYIVTPDNKVALIPNGSVANGTIVNYSKKDTRRLDVTFSISYADDFEKAKSVILDCIKEQGLALENPKPFINISSHGASSIDILTRVWCKSSDYWTIHFGLLEAVKKAFDANGISIPFPQMDIHVQQ